MSSIQTLIETARPLDDSVDIIKFSRGLYRLANTKYAEEGKGIALASLFDLAVSALYIRSLSSNGWLYCKNSSDSETNPKLYYPFVNACPRCTLRNVFYFTPSRKPRSAVIGQATSLILTTFLDEHSRLRSNGECQVMQLGGTGAVDAIAVEGNNVCLLEIKSAPLITFPVETDTEIMTITSDVGEEQTPVHTSVTLPPDYKGNLSIMISETLSIPIGVQNSDPSWPCNEIEEYLSQGSNLATYVAEWEKTYKRYAGELPKEKTYWMTNGCGQPPRSAEWPARRDASGYESISDGKSSVGLDRTDDIKKGIYQVLKIGTHYKEFAGDKAYQVFTILASNIHAVKHHEQYLREMEDMMWTIDAKDRTSIVRRDADNTIVKTDGLYNLYDGLVTFTKGHYRSDWVKERFSF